MGYRPHRKTFKLNFEGDSEFDGLMVRTISPSLGALQEILALSAADENDTDALNTMIELFAEQLLDWNVEDDAGEPVEPSITGLQSQEAAFVMSLIKAWGEQMRESMRVPVPLDETSTGGSLSAVPSSTMAPSSTNRAS